jgi:hypothetical protein
LRAFQSWRDVVDLLLVSGGQTTIEDYAVIDVDEDWPAVFAGAERVMSVPVSKYLIPKSGWPAAVLRPVCQPDFCRRNSRRFTFFRFWTGLSGWT